MSECPTSSFRRTMRTRRVGVRFERTMTSHHSSYAYGWCMGMVHGDDAWGCAWGCMMDGSSWLHGRVVYSCMGGMAACMACMAVWRAALFLERIMRGCVFV